ncbi:MAG: hypothetical protein K5Q00_01405 [Gammaproteobacteria bacterium]|nr:hypothetical protein [Gammaproteobacteria bacterium]
MKKMTIAILALLVANSALANAVSVTGVASVKASPADVPVTSTTATVTAPIAAAVTTPAAATAPTTTTAASTDTAAATDSDSSVPHLDQTISLKEGGKVLIYNSGVKVEVQNAKGQLTQTSCFDGCAIPLQRAVDFFNALKQAVQKGDKQALSGMVAYPLRVNGTKLNINSPSDFITNYSQIFTPNVTKAIIDQDPYTLFANDQGAMIGNGQVWFTLVIDGEEDTEGTVYITAVNA